MARIRYIKPEFQNSASMGNVSISARLAFILMWPQADDSGRLKGDPRMLKNILFPYDEIAPETFAGWLKELEKQHSIVFYEDDGRKYIAIVNWDHQKIDRPSPSRIPPPPEKLLATARRKSREQSGRADRAVAEPSRDLVDNSTDARALKESKVKESKGPIEGFDECYEIYPRKTGKLKALEAFTRALKKTSVDVIFGAVRAYAKERRGQEERYTKHFASWLNGECWNDQPAKPNGHNREQDDEADQAAETARAIATCKTWAIEKWRLQINAVTSHVMRDGVFDRNQEFRETWPEFWGTPGQPGCIIPPEVFTSAEGRQNIINAITAAKKFLAERSR